jgi:hypothetical protein
MESFQRAGWFGDISIEVNEASGFGILLPNGKLNPAGRLIFAMVAEMARFI